MNESLVLIPKLTNSGNMGGALGMPEEHSAHIVSHHRQQWSRIWGEALDRHSPTSMRTSRLLHGHQCSHEGLYWSVYIIQYQCCVMLANLLNIRVQSL